MKKIFLIIMLLCITTFITSKTLNKDLGRSIFQMFLNTATNQIGMSYTSGNTYDSHCYHHTHHNYYNDNDVDVSYTTSKRKVYLITSTGKTIGYSWIIGNKIHIDKIKYMLYARDGVDIRFLAIDQRDQIDYEIGVYALSFFNH